MNIFEGWSGDSPWYENGDYDGTQCERCNRTRVMLCDAPDGRQHRVCEKCSWDQEAHEFAGLIEFNPGGRLQ